MALQFFMGLATALVNMANVRLAMATIPVMGRSHFFALFSVAGSLTLGIAPVLWGVLIDALQTVRLETHGFVWNRFSIFFAAAAVAFLVALWRGRRLHEPAAAQMEDLLRDVIEQSPFRMWLRYWPRS
jgi:MFS family permease